MSQRIVRPVNVTSLLKNDKSNSPTHSLIRNTTKDVQTTKYPTNIFVGLNLQIIADIGGINNAPKQMHEISADAEDIFKAQKEITHNVSRIRRFCFLQSYMRYIYIAIKTKVIAKNMPY